MKNSLINQRITQMEKSSLKPRLAKKLENEIPMCLKKCEVEIIRDFNERNPNFKFESLKTSTERELDMSYSILNNLLFTSYMQLLKYKKIEHFISVPELANDIIHILQTDVEDVDIAKEIDNNGINILICHLNNFRSYNQNKSV